MAASFVNILHNYSARQEDIDLEIGVGSEYDDFESFENFLHKRRHFLGERWVKAKNLKTVAKANKLIHNPQKHFKESFCYAFLTVMCFRGGIHKSKAMIRKTTSKKLNCPAMIKLKANKTIGKLVVTECILDHNHELSVSPDVFFPSKHEWNDGYELEYTDVSQELLVGEDSSVTSTTTTPPDYRPSNPNPLHIDLFNSCADQDKSLANINNLSSHSAQHPELIKKETSATICDKSTNELLIRLLGSRKEEINNDNRSQHFNYALTIAEKLELLDIKTALRARKEIDDILLKFILETK